MAEEPETNPDALARRLLGAGEHPFKVVDQLMSLGHERRAAEAIVRQILCGQDGGPRPAARRPAPPAGRNSSPPQPSSSSGGTPTAEGYWKTLVVPLVGTLALIYFGCERNRQYHFEREQREQQQQIQLKLLREDHQKESEARKERLSRLYGRDSLFKSPPPSDHVHHPTPDADKASPPRAESHAPSSPPRNPAPDPVGPSAPQQRATFGWVVGIVVATAAALFVLLAFRPSARLSRLLKQERYRTALDLLKDYRNRLPPAGTEWDGAQKLLLRSRPPSVTW